MKKLITILTLPMLLFACEERWDGYERHLIRKGDHSSTIRLELLDRDYLAYHVIFDSSAIYQCKTQENQWDTNKLFGFADSDEHHQKNSARFGWRWLDGQLEILAYCYVNGERVIEELGTTAIGASNYYEIQLTSSHYVFRFRNVIHRVSRKHSGSGAHYLLFPYFGGDERAPHDIMIMMKRAF